MIYSTLKKPYLRKIAYFCAPKLGVFHLVIESIVILEVLLVVVLGGRV